jgi:hypothetical protein
MRPDVSSEAGAELIEAPAKTNPARAAGFTGRVSQPGATLAAEERFPCSFELLAGLPRA